MFLKNCWQVASFSREVGRELMPRTLLGVPVVLYRTELGEPVAMHDRCPHRAVPLSMGKLVGDNLRCGYHGLRFSPTGQCVRIPCQEQIPAMARVIVYPLVERYGFIWIWMGDSSRADPDLIPDYHWFDDPEWTTISGSSTFEANYQLINDNLLDLTHESFLHEATIGNEAVAEAPCKVWSEGDTVRFHRDILNSELPPFYVKATGFDSKINRWHTSKFQPPGFFVTESGSYPVNGTKADARERRIMHLLTPATRTTTHYFWGIARAYDRDNRSLNQFMAEQSVVTLDEDRMMLEAQQRVPGFDPERPLDVAIRADAGPIQGRRLLARLIAEEVARAEPQASLQPG